METLLDIVRWLLSNVWNLLTGVRVPLLDISVASLSIGILLIDIFLEMFGRILGISFPNLAKFDSSQPSTSDSIHLLNPNRLPAHSTRYRVSPERAHDER